MTENEINTLDKAIEFCCEKSKNIKLKTDPQTFVNITKWLEEFRVLKEKSVPKKAKWEFDDFTAQFGNPYRCSNCNEEFGDTHNYCPNCGCDMYAD